SEGRWRRERQPVPTKTRIPSGFAAAFLDWFRERTEAAWAVHEPQSLQAIAYDYASTGFLSCQWQRGTRWREGLEEQGIAQAEQRWGLCFPPDYRLFLRRLHSTDRSMLCPALRETLGAEDARLPSLYVEQEGQYLVLQEGSTFSDWLNEAALRDAF